MRRVGESWSAASVVLSCKQILQVVLSFIVGGVGKGNGDMQLGHDELNNSLASSCIQSVRSNAMVSVD